MKTYINPERAQWKELVARPALEQNQLDAIINSVFDQVKAEGDQALKELTSKFDGAALESLAVSQQEIEEAVTRVDEELKKAIVIAKNNIEKFHRSQELTIEKVETSPGVICWQESRPIEKVGLYIPGGSAPLFSTVLMLATPAKIAGCRELVMCTPPDKDGKVHPAILFAAQLVGIDKIFKVGGAQAIAALTYGTESVPSVYKIFGPGNQYVTAAKQKAQQSGVAIDMPAGPSELLVLADGSANPAFVASDLLSQAEHGPDSQVICITDSESATVAIMNEVKSQLADLPRRNIAEQALASSRFIVLSDAMDALDFVNLYAPEHLIVATYKNNFFVKGILNAGSVFLGNYTPESAGDYASGTNHTLPTAGFARSYSGVNLDSFVKKITFQEITKGGIIELGPHIEKMAAAEQLEAHKNAVTVRLETSRK